MTGLLWLNQGKSALLQAVQFITWLEDGVFDALYKGYLVRACHL